MFLPSLRQILELHDKSLKRFGGEPGILDREGLFSFPNQMEHALYFGEKDVIGLGTRIFVADVLEQVAQGLDWDVIIDEWRGSITKEAM